MTSDQVYLAFISLAVPTVAAVLALLPVTRGRLEAFARTFGVHLTPQNSPPLIRYLERTRRYRSLGGVAGWMLALLLPAWVAFPLDTWAGGIAGYLVGALLAELRTAAFPPSDRRTASLETRRVADYVSRSARLAPAVLTATALLLLACALRYPQRAEGVGHVNVVAATIGVAALAGLLVVARRAIAQRPQRVAAPDLLAADDAIRASSMQTISGAGTALLLLALSATLAGVDRDAVPPPLSALLTFASVAFPLLALLSWMGLRHWGRPVRRGTPARTQAVT